LTQKLPRTARAGRRSSNNNNNNNDEKKSKDNNDNHKTRRKQEQVLPTNRHSKRNEMILTQAVPDGGASISSGTSLH